MIKLIVAAPGSALTLYVMPFSDVHSRRIVTLCAPYSKTEVVTFG